ncbi:MAG: hypothetical protein HQ588_04205 [Deltaproteobacteria bacterium]|nr:hypothetical protein [Deltaproteobacteria bacterium]
MSSKYTFYDFIDADGDGSNVIKSWLNGEGKDSKGYFTMKIGHLETSPPPGSKDSFWDYPATKPMKGEWSGFIELRKTGKVAYRLLAQRRDRNVYLVACGTHKNQNYTPNATPQTALSRVNQMISNPTKYRRAHEYN